MVYRTVISQKEETTAGEEFSPGREQAWRSGRVMDCHATAPGSIPGRDGVFTELHVLRKGQ